MPLTFFLTNDAFYFGILPILTEAAGHYGIAPVEMARASIIGQPVHMTSPLVPALLLLVSLARVNLATTTRRSSGGPWCARWPCSPPRSGWGHPDRLAHDAGGGARRTGRRRRTMGCAGRRSDADSDRRPRGVPGAGRAAVATAP